MENKIAFIICTNDKLYCDECLYYISKLEIPDGYDIETILIENAEYMTKAYNEAMNKSDAKYKVYLHQDTFIINKRFIYDILNIFEDKNIGMIGMIGAEKMPEADRFIHQIQDKGLWTAGRVYAKNAQKTMEFCYGKKAEPLVSVQAVDGMLMVTQYDVPWREDIFCGWDFYDISQSMEFLKNNYKIVVPDFEKPWVLHDHGILNYENYDHWKDVFFKEYNEYILSL